MCSSPLNVVGKTRLTPTCEVHEFTSEGLVVTNLDVNVLAGTPFMEADDVSVRPAKRQVIIGDGPTYSYGSQHPTAVSSATRRAVVLRSPPHFHNYLAGSLLRLSYQLTPPPDSEYALEPRMNAPSVKTSTVSQLCPNPDIISRIAGKTRIPNLPSEPQFLKRNEHFCQVYPVFTPEANSDNAALAKPPTRSSTPLVAVKHSSTVRLYPTNLLPATSKPSSLPSLTSTIRA